MKRRRMNKLLSFLIMVTMLFQMTAGPFSFMIPAIAEGVSELLDAISAEETEPPPSLEDVTVPKVEKNPYDVDVKLETYPIYNDKLFTVFQYTGTLGNVNRALDQNTEHSPYYTKAITPLFRYVLENPDEVLASNLPFRDTDPYVVHPDLVLSDDRMYISLDNAKFDFTQLPYIVSDQAYLRIGAKVISGSGYIQASGGGGDLYRRVNGDAYDGPEEIQLNIPLKDYNFNGSYVTFDARNGTMTDFYIMLIDNAGPTVRSMDTAFDFESGELTLTMTFSELLRWINDGSVKSMELQELLDDFWIEVELTDLSNRMRHTLRMFITKLDGNKLEFRGQLGDFKYKDFRVARVSNVSGVTLPKSYIWFDYAVVDVASGIYTSPFDSVQYGNGIYQGDWNIIVSSVVTDHAGNGINLLEAVNWVFKSSDYYANSFEASDVKVYNEYTVNTLKEVKTAPTDWAEDIDRTQLFVGPGNTLTVQIFTKAQLTKAECKKVTAVLNILDQDGKPLEVPCTSSYTYVTDAEVYGEGSIPMTVLLFEDIELEEGMSIETEEGKPPQVKVTTWKDEIANKEAFPYVIEPSRQLYGDFTKPTLSGKKLQSTEPSDGKNYHTFTAELKIEEDTSSPPYYAGIATTEAEFFLSGTVQEPVTVRYVISSSATPPEDAAAYTKTAIIPVNGESYLGKMPVTSESVTWYLHLLAESGSLLVDDICIRVTGEDLVGNAVETYFDLEWQIDEIAPTVSFTGKRVEYTQENTAALVAVTLRMWDYNQVVSLKYRWGSENDTVDPDQTSTEHGQSVAWTDLEITPGASALATVERTFGGLDPTQNIIHTETLWVKVTDMAGNESEPICFYVVISTDKPDTHVEINSDLNALTSYPKITVTGPPALADGTPAYTRVTIAPNSVYGSWGMEYTTVVASGETLDLFSFAGKWYRVARFADMFDTVYELDEFDPEAVYADDGDLMNGWDDLINHYGELKITFENGYGADIVDGVPTKDMTPIEGDYVYENMAGASYMDDPNYYVVRYISKNSKDMEIHELEFGAMIDRENNEILGDAGKGTIALPRFYATKKNVNPMRSTRIYFTLSNKQNASWGLMDLDVAGSYIELHQVIGETDQVVARVQGLAGAETQYYTLPNRTDSGEEFVTGMYYVRVYVLSKSGSTSYFDTVSFLLDTETVQNDGLWSYVQYPYASNVIAPQYYTAEEEPFRSMGVSIATSHEVMRNNIFAVYSGGVSGFELRLRVDQNAVKYAGYMLGAVEGFRYWNMLSAPTDEELAAQPFHLNSECKETDTTVGLDIYSRADKIYTAETIPKGADGFLDGYGIYLVKGVNTICYQVKMANGYISPVRQITVIVTDYLPEFNMAVDGYVPSHEASQIDGTVNAHSVSYFVEYAYSLNGNGEVDVRTYSTYEPTVNGEATRDPNPDILQLDPVAQQMQIEDVITLTENSYTSQFTDRDYNIFCTAAFVAIDEYGGVTVVAPQLGDALRYGNSGATVDDRYNLDYDDAYQFDPYTGEALHYYYNRPVYYGAQVIRFENTLSVNNGEDQVIMTSVPQLMYNLFNISTNAVEWGGTTTGGYYHNDTGAGVSYTLYSTLNYNSGINFDLLNWDSTQITFSGGDLSESVTLPLTHRGVNKAGFVEASYDQASNRFSLSVASIPRSGNALEYFTATFTDAVEAAEGVAAEPAKLTFQLPGSTESITLAYEGTDSVSLFYEDGAIVYVDGEKATGLQYKGAYYELQKDTEDEALAGYYTCRIDSIRRDYLIEGYNIFGDYSSRSGSIEVEYTEYRVITDSKGNSEASGEYNGAVIYLSMFSVERGNRIKTGKLSGGEYQETQTDYYGNTHTFTHTIQSIIDTGTESTFSNFEPTAQPVTVTLKRNDGKKLHVDITDYGLMQVAGNDSSEVTVTVTDNTVFSYRYIDENGDEIIIKIRIDNIVKPNPRLLWDCNLGDTQTDENGTYRYGTVTVTLFDEDFTLVDRYTGKTPTFTFHPGGDASYTFDAESILATVGNDLPITLSKDIWAQLPFELREVPDPLGIYDPVTGERLEDTETPNIQILAYSNQNGYYAEEQLALRVISGRGSNSLATHEDYKLFEYVGNRGEASELLAQMGWATVYRFEVEIADMSRTRLFVKEGLYGAAPDYETGYSDNINGVKLNSRLLSVSAPAAFTLFVVDKENNSTAVAFNITNVGDAPFASTVKIPEADGEAVRVYVLPPEGEGVTDFEVYSLDTGVSVLLDEDTASDYHGHYYVRYTDNDDYTVNYRFKYNGTPIEQRVDTSIIEINRREIALEAGGIKWSDNALLEATDQAVTAQIHLTEAVAELQVVGTYSTDSVSFEIAGNLVRVTYNDNHAPITLICIADNGTSVTVSLAEVKNIDRSAPVITVAGRELAANGKSLLLTLTSNERAIFREGGYVGEVKSDNLYYYTRTITQNGTYTYHFTDMAGAVTEFEVTVTEIVGDALVIQYSTASDGAGAVTDPATLEVSVGDVVYVNPSRNVTAQMSGGDEIELTAGTWTPIEITDTMGGILPYLVAEDAYGNVLTQQFSKVRIPDGTAPTLVIERHVLSVKVGTDREEVKAALLANLTAFDDDTALTYDVEFPEDMSLTGVFNVVYVATDTAGNQGKATGKLRIIGGDEPVVWVDGEEVYRDATVILKATADGSLTVDVGGRTYTVSIKSGIKTVAQMKIGSTTLVANAKDGEPISLKGLAKGYYTVCILTQDRDYFRLILYVE